MSISGDQFYVKASANVTENFFFIKRPDPSTFNNYEEYETYSAWFEEKYLEYLEFDDESDEEYDSESDEEYDNESDEEYDDESDEEYDDESDHDDNQELDSFEKINSSIRQYTGLNSLCNFFGTRPGILELCFADVAVEHEGGESNDLSLCDTQEAANLSSVDRYYKYAEYDDEPDHDVNQDLDSFEKINSSSFADAAVERGESNDLSKCGTQEAPNFSSFAVGCGLESVPPNFGIVCLPSSPNPPSIGYY